MRNIFKYIFPTLRNYRLAFLGKDLIAGVMIAALTIPVAMGYAEIAGLPAIYGLYASILPVIAYSAIASSPNVLHGIDAGGAAITGSAIIFLTALTGQDAISLAPQIALCVGFYLMLFSAFRLGRFVSYVSEPVMTGFIAGLAITVMAGQIPKMIGFDSSGTNLFANLATTVQNITNINTPSLALALITIILILINRKSTSTIPVALFTLIGATLTTYYLGLHQSGVAIVGDIPQGLPSLSFSGLISADFLNILGVSFVISIAIAAASLVSVKAFALKARRKLYKNRELAAFSLSNFTAAIVGSPPTSASVSRTAISEQYHGKTQMASIISALLIGAGILFLGDLLYYIPQSVLGAIVFCALINLIDMKLALKLRDRARSEYAILIATVIGIILFGVLLGTFLAVILSFVDFIRRSSSPPEAILGLIPRKKGYFNMSKNPAAKSVEGIVIFRFSSSLFFANIDKFRNDALDALKTDPKAKALILDISGVGSIDSTAASGLKSFAKDLQKKKIECYFAGGISTLIDQFKIFGVVNVFGEKRFIKDMDKALAAAKRKI